MRSLIQQHRQFADVMSMVAELQDKLQADDSADVASNIIDWEYIKEWADALADARETTPPELSRKRGA